jgi:phosphoribosylaminoimidazole-succinocarboxamide synthase
MDLTPSRRIGTGGTVIVVDGNDGLGKSTLCKLLRARGFDVADRGLPTEATDNPGLERTHKHTDIYVILDAPITVSLQRLAGAGKDMTEHWHRPDTLRFYRTRFSEIATAFDVPLIDASGTTEDTLDKTLNYLGALGLYPNHQTVSVDIDHMTDSEFEQLPLVVEGESKIVRDAGGELAVVKFKPTIYSFTSNRTGVIPGSETLRLRACKIFTRVLNDAGIRHTYMAVNDRFALSKLIVDPPPIEVIIKAFHSGTSKHRYVGMTDVAIRASHPFYAGRTFAADGGYPAPLVRFDWRNPLRDPNDPSRQLADEVLGEDWADWYINVRHAKKTALHVYKALSEFLGPRNVIVYDLCLFITADGRTVFGEISQDCGRFRHYDLGSLDKDIWRAGGSSKQVLAKWQTLLDIIER